MLPMSGKRSIPKGILLGLCALLGCSNGDRPEAVVGARGGAGGAAQDVEVERGGASIDPGGPSGTVSPQRESPGTASALDMRGAADAGGELGAPGDAADGGDVSTAALETIHYYGRWNHLVDRAITVNTGSHVVARFTGTGVSARFDVTLNQSPNPTLTWRIDGNEWQEGELAATMTLGTGLADGTHEVTLMARGLNEFQTRWTPPLVSSLTFLGFDVAGGALEASPRPVRPKIEFLGDSITEGVNLWPSRPGMDTPPWRGDGRLAYASQTAQVLGAEWRQVGFGRQGLLIGGNGGVPTANDAFNLIYQGVPRDEWQPDLVTINQGTNDSGATAANFRTAYTQFLTTIRAAYPDAKIAAMRPFNGAYAAEIQAEVTARNAAGDQRVYYIDTTGWLVAADFTDGLHPNAQGSQKAAAALVTAITSIGLP
jgi:lysophospholipase L1-like esterase